MLRGHVNRRAAHASSRACIVVSCLGLAGCAKSCKDDRPYVPFLVDAGAVPAGSSSTTPVPPASSGSSPSFAPVHAERAQAATVLTIEGALLAAPRGKVLHWYLKADWDGDGKDDVAAWALDETGTQGELVWYRRQEKGFTPAAPVASAPASWTLPAGCRIDADLWRVGLRTAWLVLQSACADAGPNKTPGWAAVVAPGRQPAVRVDAIVPTVLAGESLTVQADGSDRDGDGIDDVGLTVSLSGEPAPLEAQGPAVSAELHWFDRPAGLSRDPHEPESSMRGHASRLSKLARKKGSLAEVQSSVRRLRRLQSIVCDSTAAFLVQGAPLPCSGSQSLQEADLAELDAAVKAADPAAAIAVIDRMERAAAKLDPKPVADARSRFEKGFGLTQADVRDAPGAPMTGPAGVPAWGALAFEPSGALLVRESAAVVRIDPASLAASPAASAPTAASWMVPLAAPAGSWMLETVIDGCDGSPLRARMHASDGTSREVSLPIASDPGSFCGAAKVVPSTLPLGWNAQGLEALVAGTAVRITAEPPKASIATTSGMPPIPPGAARSPDGRWAAVPLGWGVAVIGPNGKAAVWKNARLHDASRRLRDCTVANDGAAAACVEGSRVLWIAPERGKDGG